MFLDRLLREEVSHRVTVGQSSRSNAGWISRSTSATAVSTSPAASQCPIAASASAAASNHAAARAWRLAMVCGVSSRSRRLSIASRKRGGIEPIAAVARRGAA